jgi:plasmid stabilization system protein ParE
MARLNWTVQAADDLKNIFDFISIDSPKYAVIHIKRISEKVRLLKTHPELGRIVPEIGNENIR